MPEKSITLSDEYFAAQYPCPTKAKGSGIITLANTSNVAGREHSFTAQANAPYVRRSAVITNLSSNYFLTLLVAGRAEAARIYPNQSFVFDSGDDFTILNTADATPQFCVLEYLIEAEVTNAARILAKNGA